MTFAIPDDDRLALWMERVQPSRDEMDLIMEALKRWGKKDPTVCDVLDGARPGILTIAGLMGRELPVESDDDEEE